MSVPQLTTIDQAVGQKKPRRYKPRRRTKRMLPITVQFATESKAPTLQDLHAAASGAFARLIVAYVREHVQEVQHG